MMWSDVKIRMKEEIANEILFIGTNYYESYEKLFSDKDSAYIYNFKTLNSIIHTPLVRSEKTKNLLLTS